MLAVPEIKRSDIHIAEQYANGHDPARCENALWSIHNAIKRIRTEAHSRALECLFMIGVNAEFSDGDAPSLLYTGKTNKKYKRNMPGTQSLFELEKFGFAFSDLITSKEGVSKAKLAVKDIRQFNLSYRGDDFRDVIFGLKLFSDICMLQSDTICFYAGDIRVAFAGAPKLYAPPVEEVFAVLLEDQKSAAFAVHDKLEALGCIRSLETGDAMKYFHAKRKGQVFATIWAGERLWFLPESEWARRVAYKFNLRNIDQYIGYASECGESIRQAMTDSPECWMSGGSSGCGKNCGGAIFSLDGKPYRKCFNHFCRFDDFSARAVGQYIDLLELEDKALRGKG